MIVMLMCALLAHVKYMLRIALRKLLRPTPVVCFIYCVYYEHLPPIYHQQTTHTQTLEQTV